MYLLSAICGQDEIASLVLYFSHFQFYMIVRTPFKIFQCCITVCYLIKDTIECYFTCIKKT